MKIKRQRKKREKDGYKELRKSIKEEKVEEKGGKEKKEGRIKEVESKNVKEKKGE